MTTTIDGMTADEHRQAAKDCYRREYESFERSDTDGFVSQWASNMTARMHEAKADLIDDGGLTQTRVLFDTEGNVASTHTGWSKYGQWWRLEDDAAGRYGKQFFSPSKASDPEKRHAADKRKGFTEGIVRVKGYVAMGGGGRGLSGMANAYVSTFPDVDALRAHDFEVVTTDAGPDDF